jgi:hypothetical protein
VFRITTDSPIPTVHSDVSYTLRSAIIGRDRNGIRGFVPFPEPVRRVHRPRVHHLTNQLARIGSHARRYRMR